jgi:hypothetical protein
MLSDMPWDIQDMIQLTQLLGCSVDLLDTRFREIFPKYINELNKEADNFRINTKKGDVENG